MTQIERDTLTELVKILEWFESVTDEFQSDKVSISKVYPSVNFLRHKLNSLSGSLIYMEDFCATLISSLEKRFGKLVRNEVKNFNNLPFSFKIKLIHLFSF